MNENEEKIYDLIGSKSFAELTEDEKTLVLKSLGSEELYNKMREANLAAEEVLSENAPPPPEMKASVMAAFDNKEEKRGIVWWKVAAAVAVLVVGAFVFWPSGNVETEPIAENVARKDTSAEKNETPSKKVEAVREEEEIENTAVEKPIPSNAPSNPIETTEDDFIAELKTAQPEKEDLEENYLLDGDELEALADMEMDEEASKGLDLDSKVKKENAPGSAKSFAANEPTRLNIDEITPFALNKSARTSADGAEDFGNSGTSLQSIGGYDKKGYVAY
jgi:hypothetical protein